MINLSTPYPEIFSTLQREHMGAVRWYNKQIGGKRGEEDDLYRTKMKMVDDPEHRPSHTTIIDYNPPSGNRWFVTYTLQDVVCDGHHICYEQNLLVLWYETESCAGLFMLTKLRNKEIAIAINSHFFQRYNERMELGLSSGRDIILHFFLHNVYILDDSNYNPVLYERDGQQRFAAACDEGAGFGVVRPDGLYELRTFVPRSWLRKDQIALTKPLFDCLDDRNKQLHIQAANFVETFHPEYWDTIAENLANYMRNKHDTLIISSRKNILASALLLFHAVRSNLLVHVDIADIYSFSYDLYRQYECAGSRPTEKFTIYASAAILSFCENHSIPLTHDQMLQNIRDFLPEKIRNIFINNTNQCSATTDGDPNPQTNMNTMLISELKRTLKTAGAKNYTSLISSFVRGTPDSFLANCEVEYPISRIMAATASDKDLEKYRKANKAWYTFLISKRLSRLLNPIIDEYGEELTLHAIEDMIDDDSLWSPQRNASLTSHGDDYVREQERTVADIRNNIDIALYNDASLTALLPSNQPAAPAAGSPAQTSAGSPSQSSLAAPPAQSSAGSPSSCAQPSPAASQAPVPVASASGSDTVDAPTALRAMAELSDHAVRIADLTSLFSSFIQDHTQEEHFKSLCDSKDREITTLRRQLEAEKEKTRKAQLERDTSTANANKRHTEIQELKRTLEERQRTLDGITSRYNALQTEHDALKEKAASVASLPVKRTAPFSRLARVRGLGTVGAPSRLGDDVIKVLSEAPYNLVIDANH